MKPTFLSAYAKLSTAVPATERQAALVRPLRRA